MNNKHKYIHSSNLQVIDSFLIITDPVMDVCA